MDQFPPPPPPPLQPPPPVPPIPEPELAPDLPQVPWRAREGLLIVLFSLLSGGFVTALASRAFDENANLILFTTFVLEASLGIWVWLWVKLRHRLTLAALGLRIRAGDIGAGILAALLGVGAGAVVNAIVESIANQVSQEPVKAPQQLPEINQSAQWFFAGIAVVLIAPIAEELFFRGFMYQAFRRWRGVPQGMLLSAVVFAIAHVSLLIMPAIFALGVILAYLFERRGSLGATIAAHMSYNLIGFIALVMASR